MTSAVTIVEVGPRDGLQNESAIVSTATKTELVNRLSATGLTEIEVTSFVNPRAVPQMADATEVLTRIERAQNVHYWSLVPNVQGYEAARAAGADSIAVFTAASESFNERNIGTTIDGSFARFADVFARAHADGVHVRGYISCAFGCPFEGPIAPSAVHDVAQRLLDAGVYDISIGDTIGVGVPTQVADICGPILEEVSGNANARIALHLHDTRGTALSNVMAGLEAGITTFDASVGGLGGCPFAPGASGNVATEDVAWLLERLGLDTGVDVAVLSEIAQWISGELNRAPAGHIASAPLWPRGN